MDYVNTPKDCYVIFPRCGNRTTLARKTTKSPHSTAIGLIQKDF